RLALPEAIELPPGLVPAARLQRTVGERAPRAIDDAGGVVPRPAVRVGPRLLALARERPLVLRAEALVGLRAERGRLAERDHDDGVFARHVGVLEPIDAVVHRLRGEPREVTRDPLLVVRAAAGRELSADPVRARGVLEALDLAGHSALALAAERALDAHHA